MNREIKRAGENNVEKLTIGPPGDQKVETDERKCKEAAVSFFAALFSGKVGVNGEILDETFDITENYLQETILRN